MSKKNVKSTWNSLIFEQVRSKGKTNQIPLVMEFGSHKARVGHAGEDLPSIIINSVCFSSIYPYLLTLSSLGSMYAWEWSTHFRDESKNEKIKWDVKSSNPLLLKGRVKRRFWSH